MSLNLIRSSSFLHYYFMTLCFLSLMGFLVIGFVVLDRSFSLSSNSSVSIAHHSKEEETSNDLDHQRQIQDVSGETLTYDVNLQVTNENGNVVETYIYEYQK